jgi:hypothetical protein
MQTLGENLKGSNSLLGQCPVTTPWMIIKKERYFLLLFFNNFDSHVARAIVSDAYFYISWTSEFSDWLNDCFILLFDWLIAVRGTKQRARSSSASASATITPGRAGCSQRPCR